MRKRNMIPLIVYLVVLVAVFSWAGDLFGDSPSQIPYSQVVELFHAEQVRSFEAKRRPLLLMTQSRSAAFPLCQPSHPEPDD